MKTALSLIVVAALAGCATQRAPEPVATDSIGRYVFDYTVTGGKAAHLVQVFDDGAKTYVQFNGLSQLKPVIRTDTGAELPYERSGPYAIVSGVYSRLTVAVARASADVVNNRQAVAPAPAGQAVPPLTDKALPVIAAGAEAARLLELNDTHAELSRVKAELEATRAKLAEEKRRLARMAEARYVVRFADNSASLEIDGPTLEDLSDLAAHVQGLTVTGYTDASHLTPGGSRLALRRALAVRKLLQERGMDPTKIQVRYFGAGRFAEDNATPEGKAANRRVEIQIAREASA